MGPTMRLAPEYPVLTERLRLRPLSAADTEDLLAYRSLPEVCRYVPFEPMDRTAIADQLASFWAGTTIENQDDPLALGIELADGGRLIGDVILFFRSVEHRGGEIGWILNPEYSGHGYASEAARALLRLAFEELGLHRVTARVDARNHPSVRLAERLGMRREAHLIASELFKGEWADVIGFAMLEDEWAQRPGRVGAAAPRVSGLLASG